MTYTLTKNQALRLSQLEHIASRDMARPTLASIELVFGGNGLQAVATDSYRMAVMTFSEEDNPHPDNETLLVPAKGLATAIRSVLKLVPTEHKDAGIQLVPSSAYHHQVLVAGHWDNAPEVIVVDITGASAYPKWVSMFGGTSTDGRTRFNEDKYRVVGEDTKLPCMSSEYMADMYKLGGPTVGTRKEMLPWQMTAMPKTIDKPHTGGLQPWCWATGDRDDTMGIVYLLMPVDPKRRNG